MKRVLLFALAALLPPPSLRAQVVADAIEPPGSELTVYVMTMGQGDLIWERFGHNAIGIRDSRTNTDVIFNWGLFSFEEPGFIGRFIRGEMMYWMDGFDAAATVAGYVTVNRTVEIQELNLSPPQRLALLEFIRWNAREENKYYRYDYFRDNCSTRVRDALDRVLGGAIRLATGTDTTTTTYRQHAMRLLAPDYLTVVGVDIGLGRPTDRPLTRWEEMFIPMKVRDYLRTIRVPDESGALVPLVTRERTLFQAAREPDQPTPPSLVLPLLLLGAAVAGVVGRLGWRGQTTGKTTAGTAAMATWCVVVGVFGALLVYVRTMTQHVAAYDNSNIFIFNPLWLLVLVVWPLARRGATGRRLLSGAAMLAGALTVAGVVLLFVPGFKQDSLAVALLAAPSNLVVAWLLRERTRPGIAGETA